MPDVIHLSNESRYSSDHWKLVADNRLEILEQLRAEVAAMRQQLDDVLVCDCGQYKHTCDNCGKDLE